MRRGRIFVNAAVVGWGRKEKAKREAGYYVEKRWRVK